MHICQGHKVHLFRFSTAHIQLPNYFSLLYLKAHVIIPRSSAAIGCAVATFDFSIYEPDLSDLTEFGQDVLNEVRKIPYGKTITYSELADRIGSSGGARAVGQALSKNPYPIVIPCHRVVTKTGIGGYSGGVGLKKRLLEIEEEVA